MLGRQDLLRVVDELLRDGVNLLLNAEGQVGGDLFLLLPHLADVSILDVPTVVLKFLKEDFGILGQGFSVLLRNSDRE